MIYILKKKVLLKNDRYSSSQIYQYKLVNLIYNYLTICK